jgi:hypothetical protein
MMNQQLVSHKNMIWRKGKGNIWVPVLIIFIDSYERLIVSHTCWSRGCDVCTRGVTAVEEGWLTVVYLVMDVSRLWKNFGVKFFDLIRGITFKSAVKVRLTWLILFHSWVDTSMGWHSPNWWAKKTVLLTAFRNCNDIHRLSKNFIKYSFPSCGSSEILVILLWSFAITQRQSYWFLMTCIVF